MAPRCRDMACDKVLMDLEIITFCGKTCCGTSCVTREMEALVVVEEGLENLPRGLAVRCWVGESLQRGPSLQACSCPSSGPRTCCPSMMTCRRGDSLDCCRSLRSSPRDSPRPPSPGVSSQWKLAQAPPAALQPPHMGLRSSSHLQRISHPAPQLLSPCHRATFHVCQGDRTGGGICWVINPVFLAIRSPPLDNPAWVGEISPNHKPQAHQSCKLTIEYGQGVAFGDPPLPAVPSSLLDPRLDICNHIHIHIHNHNHDDHDRNIPSALGTTCHRIDSLRHPFPARECEYSAAPTPPLTSCLVTWAICSALTTAAPTPDKATLRDPAPKTAPDPVSRGVARPPSSRGLSTRSIPLSQLHIAGRGRHHPRRRHHRHCLGPIGTPDCAGPLAGIVRR